MLLSVQNLVLGQCNAVLAQKKPYLIRGVVAIWFTVVFYREHMSRFNRSLITNVDLIG